MQPEAAALYARGLERYTAHDYARAIADLEAGYAIEPRREFLFAEGQAKRLAGDCKGAVALYQRFLATSPPAVQANATQMALGRCAQHLAAHPEIVVVQPPRQPPPPPPPPPKWWRDPLGLGFTGAGAASIGVGIAFVVASYSARADAGGASSYDPYNQRWSTAESRWRVGVGTLALGTALTAVGVTRFVLVRRQARDMAAAPPPVSVSIGPGTLRLGGAF
jgi:tetratricopeptide (TPR) repeat protein